MCVRLITRLFHLRGRKKMQTTEMQMKKPGYRAIVCVCVCVCVWCACVCVYAERVLKGKIEPQKNP